MRINHQMAEAQSSQTAQSMHQNQTQRPIPPPGTSSISMTQTSDAAVPDSARFHEIDSHGVFRYSMVYKGIAYPLHIAPELVEQVAAIVLHARELVKSGHSVSSLSRPASMSAVLPVDVAILPADEIERRARERMNALMSRLDSAVDQVSK